MWLSADLSHLGLDIDPVGCADRLAAIAVRLSDGGRGGSGRSLTAALKRCSAASRTSPGGARRRLGATVQANFRRSLSDTDRLIAASIHIRLVKGAYLEPGDLALPFGEPTDVAFLRLAHRLAEQALTSRWPPAALRESLLLALGPRPVEQLFGVRP